ncbi:hypothetical protein SAMN05421755_11086 [Nitrosomonas sp. Nm33]|nr:hypothetical protein SAMN05421755_11086 [Nitrosomonas sp. Nm33]
MIWKLSGDVTCDGEYAVTIYQKRWKVEEFHKSLRSNAGLAKSPTRTVTAQNNHVFMAIYAVFKLEYLKIKHKANHFALRAKLFIKANQIAYAELQKMKRCLPLNLWMTPIIKKRSITY